MMSINANIGGAFVAGASRNTAYTLITRGPDAGFYKIATTSIRIGYHADASVNFNWGWSLSKSANNITLNSLLGKGFDISGDLGGVGISGWGSLQDNFIPSWLGLGVGVGPGGGASAGYGNSQLTHTYFKF